jgi:glycosyltransferase involved in cell wall biosynthesis
MRVAILSFFDFDEVPGGSEIFVRYLKQAFPDSEVITYSTARPGAGDLDLRKVNLQEAMMAVAIGNRFHRLNRRAHYDLIVSNSRAGWYVAVTSPGTPFMNVYHYTLRGLAENVLRGTPGYFPSRYLMSLFERISSIGSTNVAVSYKTQRELKEYYDLDSRVIENGIPTDIFSPIPRDEAREMLTIDWDGPMGIFVGRAEYAKGFDLIEGIAKDRKDIRILCVTASSVSNRELIVKRNVPNANMPIYYSAADFFIFPSRYESASYSALEAMACDLPVVVSRTGIFEDIEEDKVGRMVDTFRKEDFSKAIDHVLDRGSYHPRDLVKERYSLDRFIAEYKRMAQELVSGKT